MVLQINVGNDVDDFGWFQMLSLLNLVFGPIRFHTVPSVSKIELSLLLSSV